MSAALGRWMLMFSCAGFALGAGCSPKTSEPEGHGLATRSEVVVVDAGTIPGYQHVTGASRFHLGDNVQTDTFGAFSRWVGSDGVFAVDRFSGMVVATQDSWSPARRVAAYSTDMATHAALVRSYFEGAGLPADQIAAVGSSTRASGTGVAWGPPAVAKFIAYESTIYRAVGGFRVQDSYAEAEFNANGESVRESVYWPALPASALAEASGLAELLADPVQGPAYLARLPIPATSPVVKIHHTGGGLVAPAPFVAFGSCDVRDGDLVRHFDITGAELLLDGELPAPPHPATGDAG
jgi:hypothetical protein